MVADAVRDAAVAAVDGAAESDGPSATAMSTSPSPSSPPAFEHAGAAALLVDGPGPDSPAATTVAVAPPLLLPETAPPPPPPRLLPAPAAPAAAGGVEAVSAAAALGGSPAMMLTRFRHRLLSDLFNANANLVYVDYECDITRRGSPTKQGSIMGARFHHGRFSACAWAMQLGQPGLTNIT